MKKKFVFCLLFSFSIIFAHSSLYLSDFHYTQDKKEKKNLHDKEVLDRVYVVVDRLAKQRKSGLINANGLNLVIIYIQKQDTISTANELAKMSLNNYILAQDEFGHNVLLMPFSQIEKTRAVARELIELGYDAKAIINNKRNFYYNGYFKAYDNDCINAITTNEVNVKKTTRKKIIKKTEPLGCDIIAKMKNKTFFNPKTNMFVIDGVEYRELPKEFVDCDVSFIDASMTPQKIVNFTTDDNKTIQGELILPKEGIIDDDFFYKPQIANTVQTKPIEVKKVICKFSNSKEDKGIRTALDENMKNMKLPPSYDNQGEIELFYDYKDNFVKVSNSGYAAIFITVDNFKNYCKKVAQ